MKQGFFVRVCSMCLNYKPDDPVHKAIYGCIGDDEVWTCKIHCPEYTWLCKHYWYCKTRKQNVILDDIKHGICNECVKLLSKE